MISCRYRTFIGERIQAEEEAAAKKDEKKRLLQGEEGKFKYKDLYTLPSLRG